MDTGHPHRGPLSVGGDGFITSDLIDGGSLQGTVDPDGEVSALVTVVDPGAAPSESAIFTAVVALAAAWLAEEDAAYIDAVPSAYERVRDAAPGEQAFVAGPAGTPYSFVLTVIEDDDDRRLVEMAVIPIVEEALALDIVEILRDDLDDIADL